MDQARKANSVTPSPGQAKSCRDSAGFRCDGGSHSASHDSDPHATNELKLFWEKYDEARSSQQPGLSYKNVYIGAAGLIMVGWFITLTGLSWSKSLGGILMLAGSVIGICYSLKSLWQKKVPAHRS